MLLCVAATEFEQRPLIELRPPDDTRAYLLCGVGPLETAVRLTQFLAVRRPLVSLVLNVGIAGAYQGDGAAQLLDICLAEREIFADFGVSFGADVEPFENQRFESTADFPLEGPLVEYAAGCLGGAGYQVRRGTFLTVSAASGTDKRGESLRRRHGGLCENMEGAAAARVCQAFGLPLLELRVISNMVEDRPGQPWKTNEACLLAARAAAVLIDGLEETWKS